MLKESSFKKLTSHDFKTLERYVPIVERVHGAEHPEFHEVRSLFDTINTANKKEETGKPDIAKDLARLREITHHYTVPNGVCESYEAVYSMLSEIDKAYHI